MNTVIMNACRAREVYHTCRTIYAFTHDGIVRAKTGLPPHEHAIEVWYHIRCVSFPLPRTQDKKELLGKRRELVRNNNNIEIFILDILNIYNT